MKRLEVPYTEMLDSNADIQHIADLLEKFKKHPIDTVPWKAYDYKPKATFSLVHGNDCLFLKFNVTESAIRAKYCNTNDPVYKDSCVELFIAFHYSENYYNFEFNCLGTRKAGYGPGRKDREVLPSALLRQIKAMSVVKPFCNGQTDTDWELTLMIPVTAFHKHTFKQLSGLKARANFFKCGDELPVPHYLSWNAITAEEPNFHLPEFFGEVQFGETKA